MLGKQNIYTRWYKQLNRVYQLWWASQQHATSWCVCSDDSARSIWRRLHGTLQMRWVFVQIVIAMLLHFTKRIIFTKPIIIAVVLLLVDWQNDTFPLIFQYRVVCIPYGSRQYILKIRFYTRAEMSRIFPFSFHVSRSIRTFSFCSVECVRNLNTIRMRWKTSNAVTKHKIRDNKSVPKINCEKNNCMESNEHKQNEAEIVGEFDSISH